MKIEKLYDDVYEEVRGYKLGKWYLLKNYYCGNYYQWLVCDEDYFHLQYDRKQELIKKGKVIPVSSCKCGKEMLKELNN